jgi:NADH-quinone oxidoreductase subunit C
MYDLEHIKALAESAVPGCRLELVPNGSAANQPSLRVDNDHALAVARFLRDDPALRFDYASNVTGVDQRERQG